MVLENQALEAVGIGKHGSSPGRCARPGTSTWSRPGWRTPVTDQKPSRGQCNSATQTVTLLQARPARERVRHLGEPPNANRLVVHEFPSLKAVEAWVEDVKANREQLHTLGDLTIISVPAI